jgi:hypothetical protein
MGDRYLTDLATVLRDAGLEVVELDGWKSRARGSGGYDAGAPSVVMVHHTASPPSSSGRPDAEYCALYDDDAPLSNLCLDRDGIWWILAAGATNTNGAGGPLYGVPKDAMNTAAIGVEANGGLGDPWPERQTSSYVAGVAALRRAYGIADVAGHFEWAPTRKVDPAGPSPWCSSSASWDMNAFRADVDRYLTEGTDMPLSDDDVQRIAKAVWNFKIDLPGPDSSSKAASWFVRKIQGTLRHYLGGWDDDWTPPSQTTLGRIDQNTR